MNTDFVSSVPAPTVFFPSPRKRFQDRLEAARPALYLDASGLIVQVDAEARALLEYTPSDEIEPCFFSHIHSKNLYQVMRDVADMIVNGKRVATWFLRIRTGRKRWQWYRVYAINELASNREAICIRLSEATPER